MLLMLLTCRLLWIKASVKWLNIHNHFDHVSSSGFSLLMIVTEAVKVHPGGNTTLPCSIKDDTEINWIITNGNQTFVRILKLEYLYGGKFKTEPSIIHPSYAGRIRALSSSTNTHSLLLMNITDTDLMLFCCMDFTLEQSHCTKLDYQGICFRLFLCTLKYINLKWMIMWAINAFNSVSISISISLET